MESKNHSTQKVGKRQTEQTQSNKEKIIPKGSEKNQWEKTYMEQQKEKFNKLESEFSE